MQFYQDYRTKATAFKWGKVASINTEGQEEIRASYRLFMTLQNGPLPPEWLNRTD